MLVLVVASIALAGWRLTMSLGVGMFGLYAVFLTYSILTLAGIIPNF
jgi:Ca2+/Na+ antiporter